MSRSGLIFLDFANGEDNAPSFGCRLQCKQCAAKSKNGKRCRLRTCYTLPYCHIHSKSIAHVTIAESTVPDSGYGLFAWNPKAGTANVFDVGDVIIPYDGEIITKQQLDQRYGDDEIAPYALEREKTDPPDFIDAACERGLGAFANHKPESEANAKYSHHSEKGMAIVAIKPIKHREEIFVDYGEDYWENRDAIKPHMTRRANNVANAIERGCQGKNCRAPANRKPVALPGDVAQPAEEEEEEQVVYPDPPKQRKGYETYWDVNLQKFVYRREPKRRRIEWPGATLPPSNAEESEEEEHTIYLDDPKMTTRVKPRTSATGWQVRYDSYKKLWRIHPSIQTQRDYLPPPKLKGRTAAWDSYRGWWVYVPDAQYYNNKDSKPREDRKRNRDSIVIDDEESGVIGPPLKKPFTQSGKLPGNGKFTKSRESQMVPKQSDGLLQAAVATLEPREWLSSDVLNTYLSAIEDKHPNALIFNTHVYPILEDWPRGESVLNEWTRGIDFDQFDYLFIPVHQNRDHWTLVVALVRSETAIYMNSMRGGYATVSKVVRKYLNEEVGGRWQFKNATKVPQQENADDCGVFMLNAVEVSLQWLDRGKSYQSLGLKDDAAFKGRKLENQDKVVRFRNKIKSVIENMGNWNLPGMSKRR